MFEDDGEFYHLTETVKGVSMSALKNIVVKRELAGYVEMIKRIRSDKPGVPGEELLCPPQRLMSGMWNVNSCWTPKGDGEYVLCHNNDLRQHNIDWSLAGSGLSDLREIFGRERVLIVRWTRGRRCGKVSRLVDGELR